MNRVFNYLILLMLVAWFSELSADGLTVGVQPVQPAAPTLTLDPQHRVVNPGGMTLDPNAIGGNSALGTRQQALKTKKNGELCANSSECLSDYCADGLRCAPKDFSGQAGDYCHHDNHCRSRRCSCGNLTRGPNVFCPGWRGGNSGTCKARRKNGSECTDNRNCVSDYCANHDWAWGTDWWTGKVGRCAPKDGTGNASSAGGNYCHHDNHCQNGNCNCPGAKSFGFCADWESFSYHDINPAVQTTTNNPKALENQMKKGFFQCL